MWTEDIVLPECKHGNDDLDDPEYDSRCKVYRRHLGRISCRSFRESPRASMVEYRAAVIKGNVMQL